MTKKENLYQGLNQYNLLIKDTSLDSPNYFRLKDIPTLLTGGKNLIKIRLNPNFLKIKSEIQLEILDYNGNPIYYEFTSVIDDDGEAHVIAIYIYDDTPPGTATIYLIGQASTMPDGRPIPIEYRDSFNVSWTHQILVAPDKRNSTEILFDTPPSASIKEVIRSYLARTFPTGNEDVTFSEGQVNYQLLNEKPTLQIQGAKFSGSMVDGTLTVSNPINPQPTPAHGTIINQTYETKIKKILNPNNALLESAYKVPLNFSMVKKHTYNRFDFSNYSLTFKDEPTFVATQNSMSYANITLHDIDPATGDIYRIKTFRRSPGVVSTWQMVDDTILDSAEMMVDTGSLNINKKIGIITDQSIVNDYWNLDDSDNSISANTNIYQNSSSLNDSIKVDIGVATGIPDRQTVRLYTTASFDFFETGEYTLQFDAFTQRTGSASSKVNIFLSGSAFNYNGTEKIKGKKIGFLNPPNDARYDDNKIDFEADSNGQGTLIFEIEKGTWFFSEISIKSSQETGFGPNSTTIVVPVETQMLGDKLDFKFEYFNYQNDQAKTVTYINDKVFAGGNTYIEGENNLMTGSLYIGRKFGQGIEQSGRSSGMVRSTGYLGFNSASVGTGPAGWMMWSGSALQETNPDYYGGVGIELHGGQAAAGNVGVSPGILRFRSDDRQLFVKGEIRTRFDDGRTMNPAIPFPERFILSDQSNTFRFYLTGSKMTSSILEIGAEFDTKAGGNLHTNTLSGLEIRTPTSSKAGYWNGSIVNPASRKIAGISLLNEKVADSNLTYKDYFDKNESTGEGRTEGAASIYTPQGFDIATFNITSSGTNPDVTYGRQIHFISSQSIAVGKWDGEDGYVVGNNQFMSLGSRHTGTTGQPTRYYAPANIWGYRVENYTIATTASIGVGVYMGTPLSDVGYDSRISSSKYIAFDARQGADIGQSNYVPSINNLNQRAYSFFGEMGYYSHWYNQGKMFTGPGRDFSDGPQLWVSGSTNSTWCVRINSFGAPGAGGVWIDTKRNQTSTPFPFLITKDNGSADHFKVVGDTGYTYTVNATVYDVASDIRLKKNITNYTGGLDVITNIQPRRYQYNGLGPTEDNGRWFIGLIAQEVSSSAPHIIVSGSEKLNPDDEEETILYTLSTGKLIPDLINSIKEQQAIIESLTTRIDTLESGSSG